VNVTAPGYIPSTKLVTIHSGETKSQTVMISIFKDNKILGLPRIAFLIIACEYGTILSIFRVRVISEEI
jgi:hypothetical protein